MHVLAAEMGTSAETDAARGDQQFRWVPCGGSSVGILDYELVLRGVGADLEQVRYLAHLGAVQRLLLMDPLVAVVGRPANGRMPLEVEDLPAHRLRRGTPLEIDDQQVPTWHTSTHGFDFALPDPVLHQVALARPAEAGAGWPALLSVPRPVAQGN